MRSRARRGGQLELGLLARVVSPAAARAGAVNDGATGLSMTRALAAHPSRTRALAMVRETLHFFPELRGHAIRVGLTRSAAGLASMGSDEIWLNPYRLSRHTIAHELVHLLQWRDLLPRGEKSADVYALARHPDLADDLPAYVKVPRSLRKAWQDDPGRELVRGAGRLMHEAARDALASRQAGNRRYIVWFEEELEKRWRAVRPPASWCAPASLQQELLG